MSYRCIGHRKISNRRNERSQLIQCENTSETPNFAERPEWGFLCQSCSSQPPLARREYEEAENVGCAQADPLEFKDQVAYGFASGARRGYENDEGDSDE
jgi:hypothetical protein